MLCLDGARSRAESGSFRDFLIVEGMRIMGVIPPLCNSFFSRIRFAPFGPENGNARRWGPPRRWLPFLHDGLGGCCPPQVLSLSLSTSSSQRQARPTEKDDDSGWRGQRLGLQKFQTNQYTPPLFPRRLLKPLEPAWACHRRNQLGPLRCRRLRIGTTTTTTAKRTTSKSPLTHQQQLQLPTAVLPHHPSSLRPRRR